MFKSILNIVNAVISAGISALPLVGPLKDIIDKLGQDKALTPEERERLHAALNEGIANREERVPLQERFEDPGQPE